MLIHFIGNLSKNCFKLPGLKQFLNRCQILDHGLDFKRDA